MYSRTEHNLAKRLYNTPFRIDPKVGEIAWSMSGQGYYRDYRGILTKVDDEIPEDYREAQWQKRDREARKIT